MERELIVSMSTQHMYDVVYIIKRRRASTGTLSSLKLVSSLIKT